MEPAARLSSHYIVSVDRSSNRVSVLGRFVGSLPCWISSLQDSKKEKKKKKNDKDQDDGQDPSDASPESTHESNAASDTCDPDLVHGAGVMATPTQSNHSAKSPVLSPDEELHGDLTNTVAAAGGGASLGQSLHNQSSPTTWETVKWRVISWWLSIPAAPVEERSKVD